MTSGEGTVAIQLLSALTEVAQHSADLVAVVGAEGKVIYANPAASHAFGISIEDAVGADAFSFVHPEDKERVTARFVELVRTPGASVADSIRFVSATGETRVVEIVATNCLDNIASQE